MSENTTLANENLSTKVIKSRDLPKSLLPEYPPLYGREDEMEQLNDALNVGGRLAALVGEPGMGKSHCASAFARQWVQQDANHRLVVWLESDAEHVIRDSYLTALQQQVSRGHPQTKIRVRDGARFL
jgi:DNA replication protein DnaC